MLCCLCVSRLKKGRPLAASGAMPLAAFDMVELGLIHSQSLAGSGIPIVMWSLTCTRLCLRRAGQGRGRGTAVGGHPAVPFNGWIRCHIKNHSWLGVFSLSVQGHDDRLSACWERITKHFVKSLYYCICPKVYRISFSMVLLRLVASFLLSDFATSIWLSWAVAGDTHVVIIFDVIVGLKPSIVWQTCVDMSM